MLRLRLVRSVLRRGTRGHEPFRLYLELALSFAPGPGKRPRPEKPFALLTLTRDLDRDPRQSVLTFRQHVSPREIQRSGRRIECSAPYATKTQ